MSVLEEGVRFVPTAVAEWCVLVDDDDDDEEDGDEDDEWPLFDPNRAQAGAAMSSVNSSNRVVGIRIAKLQSIQTPGACEHSPGDHECSPAPSSSYPC